MSILKQIKTISGEILFEHKAPNNSYKLTLEKAVKEKINLTYADLCDMDLRFACLQHADLHNVNLQNASLKFATMHGANLQDANLQDANLQDANLLGVFLHNINLSRACLTGANLQYAKIQKTDFRGTNLNNTFLRFASLKDVKYHSFVINHNPIQILGLKYNITIFLEGFIQVGCLIKSLEKWEALKEFETDNEFFQKYKDTFIKMAKDTMK